MSLSILFFGSSANSAIVKQALIKAGYTIVDQPDKANLTISADYGQKLPAGGLNLHPSLLPKYRGPTPVQQQILNTEKQSGITIIKMTDQLLPFSEWNYQKRPLVDLIPNADNPLPR